ncbi:MAG TPA: ABC transporter permease [Kofleriaceae bacterium]|nr:ABC transporter permease [Kofleriaceae bacterium]
MIRFVLRRLGWAAVVIWFIVTATFAMLAAIPADPARVLLGPAADAASVARARAHYCLDEGVLVQYGCWLDRVARGDLGESYHSKRPVAQILAARAWPTIQLTLAAIVLQLLAGVPLGVLAAARRGRWPARAAEFVELIAQSAPSFVVGTVLLYVVAYRWDLLPIGGYGEGGWDRLRHLALPAATLATLGVAYYARAVRVELEDVLGSDYIRTARAKGLPERAVIVRHGLRSALGPLVTLIGLDLGVLLGGAFVVEQIYAWPGMGREVLQAIARLDLPVILGAVLLSAVAIAIANLLADLAQVWLDPRLRD